MARPGWQAPVPVICCGNVTVGGAGKTTLALDLGRRLIGRGLAAHFLLRGYGGAAAARSGCSRAMTPALVGDEALLLAELAPTWIGRRPRRRARARPSAEGAQVLVMDDGLQNPTLLKDLSLLVVDGGYGFGNGRVMPAGPLREPVAAGAARCQAAVLIGEDVAGAAPRCRPACRCCAPTACRVPTALAGPPGAAPSPASAAPEKFFATLAEAGAVLAARLPFPDHHRYSVGELQTRRKQAAQLQAVPVTTKKDAVRIPELLRHASRSSA